MGRVTRILLASAALAVLGSPLQAQQGRPGWIGVSLDIPTVDGRIVGDSVVIVGVRRDSPAERAGLRPGDRLLAVGDLRGPDDFGRLPEELRLQAGDRVRVRVERAGRPLEVIVEAAERPEALRQGRVSLSVATDSMVETMVRAMDSLRVQLLQVRGGAAGSSGPRSGASPRAGDFRIVSDERPLGPSAPFEFFVFRSEVHDSLQRAMEELTQLTRDLRSREQRRISELRRSVARLSDVDVEADQELQALRAALEEVTRESAELRAAMSDAARASAGANYNLPTWSSPVPFWTPTDDPEPEPDPPATFRPLTPYLLGSNMVAGAHVIDLRPELARYFDVAGGVLVVDVAPGTPAALAGLLPGDVVTRLDQVSIRSVEELRFGISRADDALPVSLVRHGSTLEVLLRR